MSDGLGTCPVSQGQVAEKPGLWLPDAPLILPSEAVWQGGEGSVGSVGSMSSGKRSFRVEQLCPLRGPAPPALPLALSKGEK